MKHISIVGAGSHTRSSINLLKQYFNDYTFEIYDDSYISSKNESVHNIKLVGNIIDIKNNQDIFLSIGNNSKRESLFKQYNTKIIKENLFHKTSFIENNLYIQTANQVFANVYINSYVEIGDNNIINTASILEHEVKIGSHNHISVGAKLCGRVTIGDRCMIGAGSIVIDKVSICNDVVIGAGAIVIKNITEAGTYVGNPARKIK